MFQPCCFRRSPALASRQGFTLLEVMIGVAIVGLLAAIAMPDLIGAEDRARNVVMASNVHSVVESLEDYGADHQGSYPATLFSAEFNSPDYLHGGKLPVSPWCTLAQVTPANMYGPYSFNPDDWDYIKTAASRTDLVAGWTQTLTFSDPPALGTDLGVLRYNMYPEAGAYQIFAQGRFQGRRVLLQPLSNDGS